MDRDRVRPLQERLEGHELDAPQRRLLRRHVRIAPEERHAEAARSLRDGHPDLPEADDAERPSPELHALEGPALPLAASDGGVGLRDAARQREQERDRVLGRGDGVAGRAR